MRIAVCVKWVPSADSGLIVHQGLLRTTTESFVVNPLDLVALEQALQLKESVGEGNVTVFTTGPPEAVSALRRCFAMGADSGVILCDESFDGSDSHATALILARAIGRSNHDVILCGQKATDTEAGAVGAMLAELLGISMVSSAVKVDPEPQRGQVTIQRRLERGDCELVATSLPVLVAMESGLISPRLSTLKGIVSAQKKDVIWCDRAALGLSEEEVGPTGSRSKIVAFLAPKPKSVPVFAPDSRLPAVERICLLMTGGLLEKQGRLLEGEPQNVADEAVSCLTEGGFT